jgi:hypothetical protein
MAALALHIILGGLFYDDTFGNIRASFADRLIRIVVPIILGAIIVAFLVTYLLAPDQKHRYVVLLVGLLTIMPAWIFAVKGKPLIGGHFLIACFVISIAAGMYASGGVRAPVFSLTLSVSIVVVCLYGASRAALFAILMMSLGALFVLLEKQQMLPPSTLPSLPILLATISIDLDMANCFALSPSTCCKRP